MEDINSGLNAVRAIESEVASTVKYSEEDTHSRCCFKR
jgi:hypothetical protein